MDSARNCTATRKDGRPCRAWAKRGSDPPLCAAHANQAVVILEETVPPDAPEILDEVEAPAGSLVPDAPENSGPPEQSGAPLNIGANAFYGRSFTMEELKALITLALEHRLNGEVAAARVAVRRILQMLEQELSPAEYARLAGLIFTGTKTIAQLMRAQRALSGEAAEIITGAMAKALDELGDNWEVEL